VHDASARQVTQERGCGGLLGLLGASAPAAPSLKVGDQPPPRLGWNVNLNDYRGKIVIVSFWASRCSPCRKELGVLASIHKQATRDKVVVFSVNWQESVERFRELKRALKDVDLTLISDDRGYWGKQYGVRAIPHMVIIGRDGRMAAIHVGYGEGEFPVLAQEINSLWNRTPDP